MSIKKFLYSIRNWILLIIQFLILPLFVVITMLSDSLFTADNGLPELAISFKEYLQTVTTLEEGTFTAGSIAEQIASSYKDMFNKLPDRAPYTSHSLSVTSKAFDDEILAQYKNSKSNTNLNYMVGATIKEDRLTAWFNNQAYHTAPLTVNLFNNAILKKFGGNIDRAINLINKPLPYTTGSRLSQLGAGNNLGFNIAFNSGFAISFVSALFVLFYIKERVSRAKLLQFVSGVNKVVFWLTSFVIDYVQFFLIAIIFMLTIAVYQKEGFSTYVELARNMLLVVVFMFAVLPYTYLFSMLFKVPSTGLVALSMIYIVTGIVTFFAYFILDSELLNLRWLSRPLGWVFLIFPHYSLVRGMSNLNVLQQTISECNKQCNFFAECKAIGVEGICKIAELDCSNVNDPAAVFLCPLKESCCDNNFYSFNNGGIGSNIVAMILIGVISFFLLFAFEYRWIQNLFYNIKKEKRPENMPESEDGFVDSDVLAEKNRIRSVTSYLQATNNLVIKDLTKFYGKVMAVNQICLGVDRSECFGMLGVNGAGKTSTFKMLTGDETISSGEAWVDGISIKTNMNLVHQRIGYCPQFDALLDDLTGRETLKIFALLRGVPRYEIDRVSLQLANELNFTKHLDKRTKAYSGGNKRKLSTALALIGDPSVIYLDEPTSGMDVGARRQLWNMVIKARTAGKSVVLTSHSMEECEALCTRLAIMVNGEFKCLGSTQHLKNKFSKGFFLTIKIGSESVVEDLQGKIENVKQFVSQNFSGAILKEEYLDILVYHIPATNVKWSQMFGLMEDAKAQLNIDDYSLGQTSLEQVFLFFTKYQRITK